VLQLENLISHSISEGGAGAEHLDATPKLSTMGVHNVVDVAEHCSSIVGAGSDYDTVLESGVPHASTSASENMVPAGALFDLMASWDFDGVCDTVKMVHCSGGSLSPDVLRKVRSWALLYDDVCKCMERLDSLHDELLDLISVGGVLLSGDAVQGEVSRAGGLQACGHGDCGSLRRELAEACCEIKCATCGHDFVPGICVETAWLRPVVFTRGWSCGTEFKTVGHFIWDPPCLEKGESICCPDCVSA
jgi:hypothetical protein